MIYKSKENNYKVLNSLETFFQSYLVERDVAKTLSLVTDDLYSLGTGAHEVASNKKEFENLLIEEIEAEPSPIEYKISNYTEKDIVDGVTICMCNVIVRDFLTRLTATFRLCGNEYKACNFHLSSATAIQEDREFFPLRFSNNILNKMKVESQKKLSELIMESIPGGVVGGYLEPNFPLYVINDELLGYLGYTYDEYVHDTKGLISNTIHHDDLDSVNQAVEDGIKNCEEYEVRYRMKKKDGSYIWVYDRGKKIISEDGRPAIISIIIDISETVELQNKLIREATLDSLTQVYNRKEETKLIELDLKKSKSRAILLMDLDNLKTINDACGHLIGDEVLVALTSILKANTRENDIIARVGGDEFIVYLKNINKEEDVL
ncbi:MAG TPA: hypothetical protein DC000_11270, partial [Clostridiales bacterium]|nr:hypothetical protein [Clostridiales bacterium]